MPKTQSKRKTGKTKQPKLTPIQEYQQNVKKLLHKEFIPALQEADKSVRFLKCLYFVKAYRKDSKMRKWLYSLKPTDRLIAVNNMIGPFLDHQTIIGKNPGDVAARTRTLKLLGCPALQ